MIFLFITRKFTLIMENVNWLSLVIAAIIPTITGVIYYSKPLAGKIWMESIGMTEEKQKEANMAVISIISLITAFIMAFFLLNFNNGPGQEGEFDTFGHGAAHGLILTLFLIMPVLVSKGLYEQRSWKGILINVIYWAITLALMGGVVDAMNHWPNAG